MSEFEQNVEDYKRKIIQKIISEMQKIEEATILQKLQKWWSENKTSDIEDNNKLLNMLINKEIQIDGYKFYAMSQTESSVSFNALRVTDGSKITLITFGSNSYDEMINQSTLLKKLSSWLDGLRGGKKQNKKKSRKSRRRHRKTKRRY